MFGFGVLTVLGLNFGLAFTSWVDLDKILSSFLKWVKILTL